MLAENSVPSITQTAFLESFPKFQIHQEHHSVVPEISYRYLFKCKNMPSCERHMQPYFKTSVKNESYIGRYIDYVKGDNNKNLPVSFGEYILASLHKMSLYVSFVVELRIHLNFKLPIKSWRPMRANILKQKTVKISTSVSFLTDSISEFTMTFRPRKIRFKNTQHEKRNAVMFFYDNTQELQVC